MRALASFPVVLPLGNWMCASPMTSFSVVIVGTLTLQCSVSLIRFLEPPRLWFHFCKKRGRLSNRSVTDCFKTITDKYGSRLINGKIVSMLVLCYIEIYLISVKSEKLTINPPYIHC